MTSCTNLLTHWGRVTHICVSKLTSIGSDNGLSPGRRQAIIWTNAEILLIEPLGTNFSEILIGIETLSFKKLHLKMSSGKWRPSCLGLNLLTPAGLNLFWETQHYIRLFYHFSTHGWNRLSKLLLLKLLLHQFLMEDKDTFFPAITTLVLN